MKKKDDALASAVAELRAASMPRARLLAAERNAERRQRVAEAQQLEQLRSRLAAAAPEADAWFARWVRRGRLDLVLRARPDEPSRRVELPRFHITEHAAVFASQDPRPRRGPYRWYEFALGRTHRVFGGVSGTRMGGFCGELIIPTLTALAQEKMRYPRGAPPPNMEADVLLVGLRVAELLRDGALEPLLVGQLRSQTSGMREAAQRERAERARRRAPG